MCEGVLRLTFRTILLANPVLQEWHAVTDAEPKAVTCMMSCRLEDSCISPVIIERDLATLLSVNRGGCD